MGIPAPPAVGASSTAKGARSEGDAAVISARYAELLISLTRRDAVSYTVEPLFSPPGADADVEVDPGSATFDLDALEDKLEDVPGYGALLTQCLFADPKVRTTFDTARAMSTYRA